VALPIAKAADLAKSMASKGVMGSISMGEPKEMDDGMQDDKDSMDMPDHIKPVIEDIDKLVPGLGSLMHELCEKMMSADEEQDKEDMEE
jgi:phage gp29-like protein